MARDGLAAAPALRRALHRGGAALAPALPLEALRLLAILAGQAVWWCDARGRRQAAANLAPFVPTPAARARAVRRAFANCALALAEGLRCHRLPARALARCRIDGALPSGPLVVATLHGQHELLLAAMAFRNRANPGRWQARPWDRRAPARQFEPSQLPGWSPTVPGKSGLPAPGGACPAPLPLPGGAVVVRGEGDPAIDAAVSARHAALGFTDLPLAGAARAALRRLRAGGQVG
ncbi:MAG: hypothetical protein L6R48_13850, partial [Planctomycetes bacterium]|nr:hypothetical protein [Planctomycetota bacterium]